MTEQDTDKATATRIGRTMIWFAWGGFIILLAYFLEHYLQQRKNPNQQVKGSIDAKGVREVRLVQNNRGHYYASGRINGKPVVFLLDTGASGVSIPAALAARLGLKKGPGVLISTANGLATAYSTRVGKLELGPIVITNLRGTINPNVRYKEVLLGMSVLKNLEIIQRGKQLTIRQYPD